jgi:aminoglycoside phosphotransferase (APT) family kinase protein
MKQATESTEALYSRLRTELEPWYVERTGLQNPRITHIGPVASGVVNETYHLTLAYVADGVERSEQHVLRVQPRFDTPIPRVDVSEQAQTLSGLSRTHVVPTPRVLWNETDTKWLGRPFYVMERLPGEPLFDLKKLPDDPQQIRTLYTQAIAVLAAIHAIDWNAIGLGHLQTVPAGTRILNAHLHDYRAVLTDSAEGTQYPLLERAYDWLAEHIPDEGPAVLNWGDARVGNLLFDGTRLSAVLDWEIATIAPREVDIGWFVFFERFLWTDGRGSSPGMLGRKAVMAREEILSFYEREAGTSLADLAWFERWAAFRLAVMRMRAGRQMKSRGEEPMSSRIDAVNFASIELARVFGFVEPTDA